MPKAYLYADLIDDADRYSVLGGFTLRRLGHLPHEGENLTSGDLAFEVVKLAGCNVDKVRIHRMKYAI